jgi:ADP-ribosylglycohydrolase
MKKPKIAHKKNIKEWNGLSYPCRPIPQYIEFPVKSDTPPILGAIIGDIAGSAYEFNPTKDINFEMFPGKRQIPNYDAFTQTAYTDDTVMTVATMDNFLLGDEYIKTYQRYGRSYQGVGYGTLFQKWINNDEPQPYNSFGNGSAMRVSPIGWIYNSEEDVVKQAKRSAECTHNHPEGVKGAVVTALAVFLARNGATKVNIRKQLKDYYDLSKTLDEIRPTYKFDDTCQGTMPVAILAFLESESFEHAIRLAVSMGGDADTLGAITGAIAEAYYKEIPEYMIDKAIKLLPLHLLDVLNRFSEIFKN